MREVLVLLGLVCLSPLFSATVSGALTIMPKSTYTRPGVAAAARLAELRSKSDVKVWEKIDSCYEDMLDEKGGKKLVKLEQLCMDLSKRLHEDSRPTISKDELLQLVEWKFSKGKPRWALINLLKSNQPKSVEKCSTAAFKQSEDGNISEAMKCFCELKGVGPATASALLSLHRDDLFAFMDDEVIECLYDGKRGYTLKIYLDVNKQCTEIAEKLGKNWTSRRIGRALWTAARIAASGGDDITLSGTSSKPRKKARSASTMKNDGHTETARRSSRKRPKI